MEPQSPSNTQNTLNSAASSAHGAVDKAAQAAKPAVSRAAELAHQAVDRAAGAAAPAAQWFGQQSDGLKETQDRLVSDATKYVNENPLKALAIAFVAGALISRIIL